MILLELVWGTLYDRFNRRLVMICSLLSMTAIYPLYTLHTRIWYLAILEFLTGALGVAMGPTTRAFVSEESRSESFGVSTGLMMVSSTLGGIVGSALGAFVAQEWSFNYSFYASALLSLFTAALILLSLPARKKVDEHLNRDNLVRGLKPILHTRSAWILFFAAVCATLGAVSIRSFLPLYASERIGMSTLQIGLLISATSAAQLIAMLLLGLISDRIGRRRTAILGFLLASLTFPLFFIAKSPFDLTVVSLVVSLGLSASSLLFWLVPEVTPRGLYGTVVGMYGSFEDAGVILSPILYGVIWSSYGPVSIFGAASFTTLLAALFLLSKFPKRNDIKDA